MIRALVLLSAVVFSGCYRYVPVRPEAVPVGRDVRVHLSERGAQRVEGFLGVASEEVSGELLEWSGEVVVSVPVPAARGLTDRDLRNRVAVPSGEVLGVEVRQRDGLRSALLIGGVATVVSTAVMAAVSGVFGGDEVVIDPGEEEGAWVPLWSWAFR